MKKVGIILSLALIIGLVGCSSADSGNTTNDTPQSEAAVADSATTPASEMSAAGELKWGTALTQEFDELLLDEDSVSIRAHGFSKGGEGGNNGLVRLTVKNNNTDQVKVTVSEMTIDGQAVESSFEEEVLAANSLDTDLILVEQELVDQGVTKVDEVNVTFVVTNAETGEEIATSDPLVLNLND